MRSSTKNKIRYVLWIICTALCGLSQVQFVPDAAIWLAVGGVIVVELGLWWRTRISFVDYVLDPLRPEQLPQDTYEIFNGWTPEFMRLGCGLVGDFQLAYRPFPVYVRYFLTPDQRVKGEICQADDLSAPSFITIFDDGREIETVRLAPRQPQAAANSQSNASAEELYVDWFAAYLWNLVPGKWRRMMAARPERAVEPDREDRKRWPQRAPDLSVQELYALHQRTIDLYEKTYSVTALTVTPERLLEFVQYGHRLAWWERRELPARYGIPQPPAGDVTEPQRYSLRSSAS